MGESAAQTVTEIEQTRDRIESNLRELEHRLPPPAVLGKRAIGVAVGGGVSGTIALAALRRYRKRRAKARKAKARAAEHTTVVQLIPEGLVDSLREGSMAKAIREGTWRPWLAGAGGAWFLMRAAELRRMRKLNRALLDR